MMTFCKKSVHSFLGLTNSKDNGTVKFPPPSHRRNIPSPSNGLSFIAVTGKTPHHTNVIESIAVKSPPTSPTATAKKDIGGIGFIDEDVGGGVDGLTWCTESLGFESSDERRTNDDDIVGMNQDNELSCAKLPKRSKFKKEVVKRETKPFPPPLSSLNRNGQPSFFLRPVRKDGRLELTEVRIHRPEILRASRQDGRLRLHLILDDNNIYNNYNLEEQEQEEQEEEEEVEDNIEEEKEEKIEEEGAEEWKLPVTNGGEGFRRCYELIGAHHHHHHHHHSNLHVWSQRCVTIS